MPADAHLSGPLSALEQWFNDLSAQVARLPGSRFIPPLIIFLVTYVGYRVADTNVEFYQHHVYLAEAMLHGTFDVKAAGIPDYYQDVVTVGTPSTCRTARRRPSC